jgi:hypothetical protein
MPGDTGWQNNPEGSYLLDKNVPDPCDMGRERNDVQHASRWNRTYHAIEQLCSRTTFVQVVLAFDNGIELEVGPVGAPMRMQFAGTITSASVITDQTGNLVVRILKNGVAITAAAPLTIVAGDRVTDTTLTGWTVAFVEGDDLQADVVSATTCEAFTISLKVSRE